MPEARGFTAPSGNGTGPVLAMIGGLTAATISRDALLLIVDRRVSEKQIGVETYRLDPLALRVLDALDVPASTDGAMRRRTVRVTVTLTGLDTVDHLTDSPFVASLTLRRNCCDRLPYRRDLQLAQLRAFVQGPCFRFGGLRQAVSSNARPCATRAAAADWPGWSRCLGA